jgi:polyisoprenoid-binding protein YceI
MSSALATTTLETPIPGSTETWMLDPSHTQVGFAVKHLMISNVKGRFPEVTGTVRLDERTGADIEIVIKAESITTQDVKRDAHLRSADFLHADQFPEIRFTGGGIEGKLDSKFSLHGQLEIRGVTRPVTLYVINQGGLVDPWGNARIGYIATATINRKDFGLEWNMALEAGGVLVADEVRLTIETELVRQ